ncbi:Uncharacterized protein Adt_39448 [Abeliophyllum distichum]|uniref:Uncharacterized protein n=1 Tax=Abeliophyllum distichum TaxID=126358 RepID=A0ABD1Q538_9LAMI
MQKSYIRAAKKPTLESFWVGREAKSLSPTITFGFEDETNIQYPYCDALEIQILIAINVIKRMLVDNESLVNILFGSAFNQIEVDHPWTPISESLYGFTGTTSSSGERSHSQWKSEKNR